MRRELTPFQHAMIGKAMLFTSAKIYREVYGLDAFDEAFYDCANAVCDLGHYWSMRNEDEERDGKIFVGFSDLATEWYLEDLGKKEEEDAG